MCTPRNRDCLSLLTLSATRRAVETAVIGREGREGLVGSVVALGSMEWNGQANVPIKGCALKRSTADFMRLNQTLSVLPQLVNRHIAFLLFQAQHNAVCYALHSVEARLCRWILQASDTLGSDVVELTQEICSHSLGVQRTSVSMVAHALQVGGLSRTRHGKILIMNRPELEKMACDCYRTIKLRNDSVFAEAA